MELNEKIVLDNSDWVFLALVFVGKRKVAQLLISTLNTHMHTHSQNYMHTYIHTHGHTYTRTQIDIDLHMYACT